MSASSPSSFSLFLAERRYGLIATIQLAWPVEKILMSRVTCHRVFNSNLFYGFRVTYRAVNSCEVPETTWGRWNSGQNSVWSWKMVALNARKTKLKNELLAFPHNSSRKATILSPYTYWTYNNGLVLLEVGGRDLLSYEEAWHPRKFTSSVRMRPILHFPYRSRK